MIGQLQRQHVPGHHARQVNDPQAVEHTLEIGIEGFLLHCHLFYISMPYTTESMCISQPFLTQPYIIMAGPLVLPEREHATRWRVCTADPGNMVYCGP
jgi:hypothetical protein